MKKIPLVDYKEYEYLIAEWSSKNEKTPHDVSRGSTYKAIWVCSLCEGEWKAAIGDRIGKESGCPFCYNKKSGEINRVSHTKRTLWDMREDLPQICQEWSCKNVISIKDISWKSSFYCFWVCRFCGYNWKSSLNNRVSKGSGCPSCHNKKRSKLSRKSFRGTTLWDVREELPHIIKEYSLLNLLLPNEISRISTIKFLWDCSTCSRQWSATLDNRIYGKTGCPYCNESKLEKQVRRILEKYSFPFRRQYAIGSYKTKRSQLKLDFLVIYNEIPIALECQGRQHYVPIQFFGGGSGLQEIQERDERKRVHLQKLHIPLIEVPYWEKNIEGFLLKNLEKIGGNILL